ncbi:MAG: hypothetical protein HXS46_17690 [Theionarchaea archaeon]|nr:hypothetical protein [Theionarchaea archaeon]
MGRGGGRGRKGGFAMGPGGKCVCPTCGYEIDHQVGAPCYTMTCPKCNKPLTRKR